MFATSPRQIRRRRHGLPAPLELLETRALLAAQPTAVADAYSVAQGQTLAVSFARNYVVATVSGSADPYTWTTADGPVTVYNVGTGDVMLYAGINTDQTTGWSVVLQTFSGLPLQPGTYDAAGSPAAQAALRWFHDGIHQQDGQFTIQHFEFDQGNYVTRVDADFVLDGGDSGSVHYSGGTRGVLDNDLGPAVGVTAALVTGPAHGSLSLNADGTFSYTPAPGFAGDDSFTYAASDGVTTSAPATVTLHVFQINQAPSFAKGSDVTVTATGAPQSFAHWATNLSPGTTPFDAGQSLTFSVVGNSNPYLFSQRPTVDSAGNLTFTAFPNINGTATISIALHDSGGTANGGQDTSPTQTFTITLRSLLQYSGDLFDVYPQANGNGFTPLAGRGVFDDANGNGVPDPGEAVTDTNVDGVYTFSLPAGNHTFRAVPMAGWVVPGGYADSVLGNPSASNSLYTTMAHPVVIDVLAVHPSSLLSSDGGLLPWDTAIRNAFLFANRIFANSDTNIRLHLLAVESVDYVPANNLEADLKRLAIVGDGALDTVPKRRDALKADLAILFDANPDPDDRAGVAPVLNPAHPDASRGYAVVVAGTNASAAGTVLAHEIGHTLGADHDGDNGPKNFVRYAHGYRFTGDDGDLYRDVMAYAPGQELPFFSSPRITYAGHAVGDAATADNARVVRENAYTVASYRGQPVFAPDAVSAVATAVTKSSAKAGDTVTAKVTLRDNAASTFSGKVAVSFYLSKNKAFDASDTLVKKVYVKVKNLASKRSVVEPVTFKLAKGLKARGYYVLAVATTTGAQADERAAKPATSTRLLVSAPAKKAKKKVRRSAVAFQTKRPIVDAGSLRNTQNEDRAAAISWMLRSPR